MILRQPLPEPEPTPEDARRAAERILERPEFEELEPTFFDRITDWINERIAELLGDLVGSGGNGGSTLGWVLMVVLVLIVGYFVVRLLLTLQRSAKAAEEESAAESQRAPEDWLRLATEHEDAGEWKDALVAHYRHVVGRLIRREIASDVPGRTTGEFRADVAHNAPAVSDDFDRLSDLFEVVWFGDVPPSPDDVAMAAQLGRSVLAASTSRRREAVG